MKSLLYIVSISPHFPLVGCAQRVGQNCGVKTLTKPFPEPTDHRAPYRSEVLAGSNCGIHAKSVIGERTKGF